LSQVQQKIINKRKNLLTGLDLSCDKKTRIKPDRFNSITTNDHSARSEDLTELKQEIPVVHNRDLLIFMYRFTILYDFPDLFFQALLGLHPDNLSGNLTIFEN